MLACSRRRAARVPLWVALFVGYLEACMRFYPNAKDAATNSTPIFLSSGAEDYFLSASYFDEGEFISPNSGLTYKAGGAIGSYKLHDLRDQVRLQSEGPTSATVTTADQPN
jgi:hypothetical protein